jgi:hypothetical protein
MQSIKTIIDRKLNIRRPSFSIKKKMLKISTRSRNVNRVTNLSFLLNSLDLTSSQSDATESLDEYLSQQSKEDQQDQTTMSNITEQHPSPMNDLPSMEDEERTHDHIHHKNATPTNLNTNPKKRVSFAPSLVTQVNIQPRTDDRDWHEHQRMMDKRNGRDGLWNRQKRCIITAEEVDLDL